MNTNEIRETFLSFYEKHGHKRLPSGGLIPNNDPTLLFNNAGMNQFKDFFLDPTSAEHKRVTTTQKCLRIAGKHNDFENVGHSACHHTFFEMLGNFSFGDYFKKEAIEFAWELSLKELALDQERIWVTVLEGDDESEELWKKHTNVDPSRILRLGPAENFWTMGETGPCGPCSELHYYLGEDPSKQSAEAFLREDPEYMEYYNLVFMQYNLNADGSQTPLPHPCIDTGMGLERVARIKLAAASNYDAQGFRNIISFCEERSGFEYSGKEFEKENWKEDKQYTHDFAMRVLADHGRSATFLLAEGVQPGSEGRNYITRRLVRRAVRHARNLGIMEPFLYEVCGQVAKEYEGIFPELKNEREFTKRAIKAEEEKFIETLESGLKVLEAEKKKLGKGKKFPGDVAFQLHDTYGFPLDLTADALKPDGILVDQEKFNEEMTKQKERSKQDRKGKGFVYKSENVTAPATEFIGYQSNLGKLSAESKVQYAEATDEGLVVVCQATPFYAESGGQVGDQGTIAVAGNTLQVVDTQKTAAGQYLHFCQKPEGLSAEELTGKSAELSVDTERRREIRSNHSATHLLHSALRRVLGDHVRQAGSRVDENSFRFDYSHFEAPSPEQLQEIEALMTEDVASNFEVATQEMEIELAKKRGAMALFGEKYGDKVRVVEIGPNSLELCGGTHAERSGDIGGLVVMSEGSVAAGTRRIECLRGANALRELQRLKTLEGSLSALLKSSNDEILERTEKLLEAQRELKRELDNAKQKLTSQSLGDLLDDAVEIGNGVKLLTKELRGKNMNELRELIDVLRGKIGSGAVVLASPESDGSLIAAGLTKDLSSKYHVGNILKSALSDCGGRGGGRDTFAQGGGVQAAELDSFFAKFRDAFSAQ